MTLVSGDLMPFTHLAAALRQKLATCTVGFSIPWKHPVTNDADAATYIPALDTKLVKCPQQQPQPTQAKP